MCKCVWPNVYVCLYVGIHMSILDICPWAGQYGDIYCHQNYGKLTGYGYLSQYADEFETPFKQSNSGSTHLNKFYFLTDVSNLILCMFLFYVFYVCLSFPGSEALISTGL